jgi:hypothetical protein
MTDYQVVCVERSAGGIGHITGIGTGIGNKTDKHWTVTEVRSAIKKGDTFHIVSPTTKVKAYVEPFDIPGLRTKGDKSKDDNLDHLRACKFPK